MIVSHPELSPAVDWGHRAECWVERQPTGPSAAPLLAQGPTSFWKQVLISPEPGPGSLFVVGALRQQC